MQSQPLEPFPFQQLQLFSEEGAGWLARQNEASYTDDFYHHDALR